MEQTNCGVFATGRFPPTTLTVAPQGFRFDVARAVTLPAERCTLPGATPNLPAAVGAGGGPEAAPEPEGKGSSGVVVHRSEGVPSTWPR